MIQQKHPLSNGDMLVWLGNQPIQGCEDVLLLASGDVLFLKPVAVLKASDVRQDVGVLDRRQFIEKYRWPDNSSADDLYAELKGVR
jgi:hypothetical protein